MAAPEITQLDLPMDAIRDYCQRWHIVEFAVFGSVLREDFSQDSDIDILVKFRDDQRYTLFDLSDMTEELETILGRKVDLLTRNSVEQSPNYIRRKSILQSAQVIYAEG